MQADGLLQLAERAGPGFVVGQVGDVLPEEKLKWILGRQRLLGSVVTP
jgi:hypothetical protein